jgi:hypothetical protein
MFFPLKKTKNLNLSETCGSNKCFNGLAWNNYAHIMCAECINSSLSKKDELACRLHTSLAVEHENFELARMMNNK